MVLPGLSGTASEAGVMTEASLLSRIRGKLRRLLRGPAVRAESEAELAAASMKYWNEGDKAGIDLGDYSHWKGTGPWQDHQKWLALGRVHFEMYERLCLYTGVRRPLESAIEWGCGGGANAIHFVDEVKRFCGVEIARASLDECGRVLAEAGYKGFEPVLIAADTPESALQQAAGPFDLFLSTYVFELIPGRAYGERIARVAFDLLKPGGLALIQIRYDDGSNRSNQKTENYFDNACRFTSYRVEDFWVRMQAIGFQPLYVRLVPKLIPGFSGDLYAYFAMVKPA
jgi:SAM-dependent methyltransferase